MDQVPQSPAIEPTEVAPERNENLEIEETPSVDAQVRHVLTATSPGK